MGFFTKNFEKKLENIMKIYHEEERLKALSACKGISKRTDKILKKFLRKNHRRLTKSLLTSYKIRFQHNGKKLFEDYTDTLSIMIKELFESERVDWSDVKKIGEGTYSEVYQIGNKILKIGNPRKTYEIPNHRRILQPLIRLNFTDDKNGEILACVEITNRAKKMKGLTDARVYQIYKELRDDGIIWTDARADNIGMLIEPNFPTLRGRRINVARKAARVH